MGDWKRVRRFLRSGGRKVVPYKGPKVKTGFRAGLRRFVMSGGRRERRIGRR